MGLFPTEAVVRGHFNGATAERSTNRADNLDEEDSALVHRIGWFASACVRRGRPAPRSGQRIMSDVLRSAVAEVPDRRDAQTRVFRNSDGTLTVNTYLTPINYHSTHGWVPIDNAVKPVRDRPGWVGTAANSW